MESPDYLILSGKFIKQSNLSKTTIWKSRTFELWSSGLLTYKNRVGLSDERNIKDATFRIVEQKVPLGDKKNVVIKALEIKTPKRRLTIAFHAESPAINITHIEGFKKVIKENFHRDFIEDEPLLNDHDSSKFHEESDDDNDSVDDHSISTTTVPLQVQTDGGDSKQIAESPKEVENSQHHPLSPRAPPSPSRTRSPTLELIQGNRDGVILGVIFAGFAILLIALDFLLKKL